MAEKKDSSSIEIANIQKTLHEEPRFACALTHMLYAFFLAWLLQPQSQAVGYGNSHQVMKDNTRVIAQ